MTARAASKVTRTRDVQLRYPRAHWTLAQEVTMADPRMTTQISGKPGFLAALDQSGGSTPGALRTYGIPDSAYSGDAEMFRLMHEMRVRIMTSPAFTGDKIIGAILFEKTMDGEAAGKPVPAYLWQDKDVVPFLKIDKGLQPEADGVSMLKPIPDLDTLLGRAVKLGIFGTKERSTIRLASRTGIAAIAAQQFEVGRQVLRHGLVPILEPEVLIKSPEKAAAEAILRDELLTGLDALGRDDKVMIKLTIPEVPDLYKPVIEHPRSLRIVALSGGYPLDEACRRLSRNHGMIASFSRALLDDLRLPMSAAEFDATLARTVDQIYRASTIKE
jgi:fructose-bisphosphate aldolase class I